LRIVFAGTPEFAVPCLEACRASGAQVVAVYTQPDRPAGRGRKLAQSPVKQAALAAGLAVEQPESLKSPEAQATLAAYAPDLMVVVAYGLILPRKVLAIPRFGCWNVHASLLPRWRGAAPIQRAILAGDAVTGVTIMDMEAGLDTGPMRATVDVEIGRKTAGELTAELAEKGAALMVQVLGNLAAYPSRPQPEDGVTYASKVEKAEARLDFSAGAVAAERQVRAYNPAPGAFFEVDGERIRVLEATVEPLPRHSGQRRNPPSSASYGSTERQVDPGLRRGDEGVVLDDDLLIDCGADALRPIRVQRAGRGVMSTGELLRGFPIPAGTRLS
jgi:methionyl-tRNA formyltransferase